MPLISSDTTLDERRVAQMQGQCIAVCGVPYDGSYCGEYCRLTQGHNGPHHCSRGHEF